MLIAMIGSAFSDVTYPGDNKLLHPECSGDDSDIRRFYGLRNWRTVPERDIVAGYAAFSFLSPDGFQFLLPAFMVWSLNNLGVSDAFALDSTVYSLNPLRRGRIDHFAASKYTRLTKVQVDCVLGFLRFICEFGKGESDTTSAEEALAQYWSK